MNPLRAIRRLFRTEPVPGTATFAGDITGSTITNCTSNAETLVEGDVADSTFTNVVHLNEYSKPRFSDGTPVRDYDDERGYFWNGGER